MQKYLKGLRKLQKAAHKPKNVDVEKSDYDVCKIELDACLSSVLGPANDSVLDKIHALP